MENGADKQSPSNQQLYMLSSDYNFTDRNEVNVCFQDNVY